MSISIIWKGDYFHSEVQVFTEKCPIVYIFFTCICSRGIDNIRNTEEAVWVPQYSPMQHCYFTDQVL